MALRLPLHVPGIGSLPLLVVALPAVMGAPSSALCLLWRVRHLLARDRVATIALSAFAAPRDYNPVRCCLIVS